MIGSEAPRSLGGGSIQKTQPAVNQRRVFHVFIVTCRSSCLIRSAISCTRPLFQQNTTSTEVRQLLAGVMVSATLIAVFLFGYATWWWVLAVSAVAETYKRARVPFNLGIWGSVFPWGVWAACACLIAKTTHSLVFAIIGAATVVSHIGLWLVVVALTAQRAYRGDLFHAPCLHQQAAGAAASAHAAKVEDRLLQ